MPVRMIGNGYVERPEGAGGNIDAAVQSKIDSCPFPVLPLHFSVAPRIATPQIGVMRCAGIRYI